MEKVPEPGVWIGNKKRVKGHATPAEGSGVRLCMELFYPQDFRGTVMSYMLNI